MEVKHSVSAHFSFMALHNTHTGVCLHNYRFDDAVVRIRALATDVWACHARAMPRQQHQRMQLTQ